MTERREGHFEGYQGVELFYQCWTPMQAAQTPKCGTLVITHGISEHSECYAKTAERLNQYGYTVYAWDLRGHGRSEGKRGYVADFGDFAKDLDALLRYFAKTNRLSGPFALIGHSLGGLITLDYLLKNPLATPKPAASALSSPALGVALAVPPVKDFAARILNRVLPSLTLHNEIQYEDLTRDSEFLKGYGNDPLRHDKISPAVYLGMLDTMAFVNSHAADIQVPLLIQAAGHERIVSLPAIREFFSRLGSREKKLLVYEESYHEIFNDLDRETVFHDLDAFLRGAV